MSADEATWHPYGDALPAGATREQRLWAERMDGKYHGYPACCIAAFVADIAAHRLPWATRTTEVPGLNDCPAAPGYVPCQACARKLVAEDAR